MYRRIFIAFGLTIFTLSVTAQRKITMYIDRNYHILPDRKGAAFYREIELDAQNRPKPEVRMYYMNGIMRSQATKSYIDTNNLKNDTSEGVTRWYYETGRLSTEANYRNNKLNGNYKSWYEDGILRISATFIDGLMEGDYTMYYNNGNYQSQAKFKNGALVGKKCYYYDNYTRRFDYFFDEFYHRTNFYDWNLRGEDDFSLAVIPDTGLSLQNNSKHDVFAYVELPFNGKGSFFMEVKVQKDFGDEDAGYGMVFDYFDDFNYSYFMIRSDGMFSKGRKLNGVEQDSTGWLPCKKLSKEGSLDRLLVKRDGAKMIYQINGRKVAEGVYINFTHFNYGAICQKGNLAVLLKGIYVFQY